MAASLSTSVQDTDVDVSLEDLVMDLEGFRPHLEEEGYHFVENDSSNHELEDLHLAIAEPQNRAMTSGGNRLSLGQRNEDHYRAWLSVDADRTDFKLEDEQLSTKEDNIPNDVINPSFQEEVQPVRDLENDLHGGEVVGVVTQTKKEYTRSPRERASTDFIRFTIPLEKILLGGGYTFLFDDIVRINQDVMRPLADLHAQSIVYLDMHINKIFINDHMRALLIDSPKSKKQSNRALLIEESVSDVKELCKVMGGLCSFYKRNKPPDSWNSNQEAETALFSLIWRGYRDGTTAHEFLEELSQIIVKTYDEEREEAPRQQSRMKKKHDLGPASRLACSFPKPDSRAIDRQVPQPDSRSIDRQVPQPKSRANDRQVPQPDSRSIDRQVPQPNSRGIDRQVPQPNSRSIDHQVPQPSVQSVDNQQAKSRSGGVNSQITVPKTGAMDFQGSEPESEVVNMQIPEPEVGDIQSAEPEKECGDKASESLELVSEIMEDISLRDKESFPDEAVTHEKLLSDFEKEIFLSN